LPTAARTPPCTCDTQRSPGIFDINDTALHVGALDKALDIWYNTGVGLKKNTQTGAMNDND